MNVLFENPATKEKVSFLYQWDTNVDFNFEIENGTEVEVAFSAAGMKEGIRKECTNTSENNWTCKVPDTVLACGTNIRAFITFTDNDGNRVVDLADITVVRRPKPAGYIAKTDDEYITAEKMLEKMQEVAQQSEEEIKQIVEDSLHDVIPDSLPASDVYDWAKQPQKPTYTADEVGARPATWTPTASEVGTDPSGTAASKVLEHNTSDAAHNDIRLLIEGLTSRLNALADSDDTTLDQMSEVVAYIKSNKSLIDAITTNKVSVSDIVDNLTTNVANKPLSAAQGVALKKLIDAIVVPTKLSQFTNDTGFITGITVDSELSETSENPAQNKVVKAAVDSLKEDLVTLKETCVQEVIDSIGAPVFGTVDENNVVTLTGDLGQGTYTIKYEMTDGTLQTIGTVEFEPAPSYTNQIPLSTDKDGNIFNSVGYKAGCRANSSGTETVEDGYVTTGFIPATSLSVLRFKNISWPTDQVATYDNLRIYFYDSDYNYLCYMKMNANFSSQYLNAEVDENNNLILFGISEYLSYMKYSDYNVGYVRLTALVIDNTSICTVDEVIE